MNCPSCGHQNAKHYKFCLECGGELSAPKSSPSTGPITPPEKAAPRLSGLASAFDVPAEHNPSPATLMKRVEDLSSNLGMLSESTAPPPSHLRISGGHHAPPNSAIQPEASPREMKQEEKVQEIEEPKISELMRPMGISEELNIEFTTQAVNESLAAFEEEFLGDSVHSEPVAVFEVGARSEARAGSQVDSDPPPIPSDSISQNVEVSLHQASNSPAEELQRRSSQASPSSPSEDQALSCGQCGTELPPGFLFCGRCGHRIQPSEKPAPSHSTYSEQEVEPTPAPVLAPVLAPVPAPLAEPTPAPVLAPVLAPVPAPLAEPTPAPVLAPVPAPLAKPTPPPFVAPAPAPIAMPVVPPEVVKVRSLKLIRIHLDGSEGESQEVTENDSIVGRDYDWDVFQSDPYLSGKQARFDFEGGEVKLVDLDSRNGVFVKIKQSVEVQDGDFFRAGQQLFCFESFKEPHPIEDGEPIQLGSPAYNAWGRLCHVVGHGLIGKAWLLQPEEVMLGRVKGEIVFDQDRFMSSRHCTLSKDLQSGRITIQDLQSTNGTFVRVRGEVRLDHDDLILLGQKIYKVQL